MSRTIALVAGAILVAVADLPLAAQQPPAAPPQRVAPAAQAPMRFAIADNQVVIIRQGEYRYYEFSVSIPSPCTVHGQIVGLAGGNKDFQALIMDRYNFLNWKTTHEAQVYWASGQVAATDLALPLSGPKTYYLVISNLFSRFTKKTIQVRAYTQC